MTDHDGEEQYKPSLPALPEEAGLDYAQPEMPPRAPDLLAGTGAWELHPDIVTEREKPPYIAGTIDVAAFVKSQSAFLRVQSAFLRRGRLDGGEAYIHHLTDYSKAQDDYIQSMHEILQQLGVM